MKTITFVNATFGDVDVVVKENKAYLNTVEVGNKRLCFDEVLPDNVDLRTVDNYQIIIYDGVNPTAKIIVNNKTYLCRLCIPGARHEEIVSYKW